MQLSESEAKHIRYQTAIYVRLSREDDEKERKESNSIINQKLMLIKYIDEHEDLLLFDIYCDDGYTGTNIERPAFQRMLEDIKKGLVNCVIVKDLSRFGRSYIDVGIFTERYFVDSDIRFIAVNDNYDSLYDQYDLILPIKNVFNQQYAVDISKKVQSSFKVKQREGQFIGAFASYGYKRSMSDKHKLVIDEYAADVVRRIFDLYAAGSGKIRIANILNSERISCPSEYKKECGLNYRNCNRMLTTNYWTYSTIDKILKNQMYHGDMVQGKTKRRMKGKVRYLNRDNWVIVKGTHPAIIDDELWNRVQKALERDTRNTDFNSNVSIFAGFLRCGDCGRAMTKNRSAGQIYYVCATYKNYGKGKCSSHRINQVELENIILEDLNVMLSSIVSLEKMADQQNKAYPVEHYNLQKAVENIDIKINNLIRNKKASYNDYRDGTISKEEFIEYKLECDYKIDLLRKQNENTRKKTGEGVGYTPWVQRLLEINKIEVLDKEIIDEMIDMIYVYQDKAIKVVYNFNDELELLLSRQKNNYNSRSE